MSLDLSLGRITRKSQMDEVAGKYAASVFRAFLGGQGLGAHSQPTVGRPLRCELHGERAEGVTGKL